MNRLEGKIALVTGGSRGIGKCIVDTFVKEGIEKVISLSKSKVKDSEKIKNFVVDISDYNKVISVVNLIKKEIGSIDILVNNAGIVNDNLINKIDENDWDSVVNVNLKGVFNVTKEVSQIMIEQGYGSIVNISSVVGLYGNIGQTSYSATKSGIIGMSYTWSKEFTRKGANIRTNVVAPGYIETDMIKNVPDKILSSIKKKTPLGRLGTTQEIANAVLFLASDESSYINGHVLEVTGGLRL